MNTTCISLIIRDICNVNCFNIKEYKAFTDITTLEDIRLKFGYILSITQISSTYINLNFKSITTDVSFPHTYNTAITYSLPVEGGTYCIEITPSRNTCGCSYCQGG